MTPLDRLLARCTETPSGCWRWTGAINHNGYGVTQVSGHMWRAHRLAYTALVGPIPNGLDLDHLCRNRACCNPAHLEPVTRAENLRRGRIARALAEGATERNAA